MYLYSVAPPTPLPDNACLSKLEPSSMLICTVHSIVWLNIWLFSIPNLGLWQVRICTWWYGRTGSRIICSVDIVHACALWGCEWLDRSIWFRREGRGSTNSCLELLNRDASAEGLDLSLALFKRWLRRGHHCFGMSPPLPLVRYMLALSFCGTCMHNTIMCLGYLGYRWRLPWWPCFVFTSEWGQCEAAFRGCSPMFIREPRSARYI